MIRPLDRHLDGDEIDALVASQVLGVSVWGTLSQEAIREAQRHVESCEDCDREVKMHRSAQSAISLLAMTGHAAKGPNCSEETEWVRVAAGLLEERESKERMGHAAQCRHCGPLLKAAVRNLADETTPDEEAVVAKIRNAHSDWQAQMVRSLRRAAEPRPTKASLLSFWESLLYWPRSALAAAAIAILVSAAWISLRPVRPPSAEQLLAKAYAEHRTIEIRIPGAKYAPLRVERSGATSNFDKPEPLLKAEALIGEKLQQHPNDPDWLEARARAELLDGSYNDSIKTLQRALESRPDSAEMLTDLGSAYFLRAKATDRSIDYGYAIESLGKALINDPDNPIALFNRALACEQMFLYTQAIEDWEHYLRIDPSDDWSEEARKRLAAVQNKVQEHEKSRVEPLLTPSEIAKAGWNSATRDKIDERIESYLHEATTKWLPQAFPSSSTRPRSADAKQAVAILAEILKERHNDVWLSDLLSAPAGSLFSSGVEALSSAVLADDAGDYSGGAAEARRADKLFQIASNLPAQLRAQAEEVYSDHLLWQGHDCISLLRQIEGVLKPRNYGWIQAQLSLERSNCANIVGDLGTYQDAIHDGTDQAQVLGYTALHLRGLGFESLSDAESGKVEKAFARATEGLAVYWSRPVDLMKGYNLYYDLDSAADEVSLSHLRVLLWREATVVIDQHPDVLLRAMAHRWYGNAAYLADQADVAANEFSLASRLFAASPQTAATKRDQIDAEIWLAQAEIRKGNLDRASSRLQNIKSDLKALRSLDHQIWYYSAEAELAMQRANTAATESSLRPAIFLAEWGLHSLLSQTERQSWAEQSRSAYRDLVEWKLRQGDVQSALEFWEWYKGAEFRAADAISDLSGARNISILPDPSRAPQLPSPTAVTNILPVLSDRTVISYGTFHDGIAVWVYDDRGVKWHWISISLAQLRDQAIEFRRFCADPQTDLTMLRAAARSLYDLLVAPVDEQLGQRTTLVFEPDEFLNAIPWDALVDSNGHYLAERAAVVVSPGLYHSSHLRRGIPVAPGMAALIVSIPTAPGEGLHPLSDAEDEAQAVAREFSDATLLEGAGATAISIRREIRGKTVFHFAGHAIASPERSGLVLDEPDPKSRRSRLLTPEDFQAEDLSALQLAVLSACHTGEESQLEAAGTESMTTALLRAGVPHVMASRWAVDSQATRDFMQHFYAALIDGQDTAKAANAARLALSMQPGFAHPYYWAAFELMGTK